VSSYQKAAHEGETLCRRPVLHWKHKYLNNWLEQDHRGVKKRYYPMHGFGSFESAAPFCCAFDELRNYLRSRCTMGNRLWGAERIRGELLKLDIRKITTES
jgi:putative transposase